MFSVGTSSVDNVLSFPAFSRYHSDVLTPEFPHVLFVNRRIYDPFNRNFRGSNIISDTGCPNKGYVTFHSLSRQAVGHRHTYGHDRVFSNSSFAIIVSFGALR